jgi:hypothetical protein
VASIRFSSLGVGAGEALLAERFGASGQGDIVFPGIAPGSAGDGEIPVDHFGGERFESQVVSIADIKQRVESGIEIDRSRTKIAAVA